MRLVFVGTFAALLALGSCAAAPKQPTASHDTMGGDLPIPVQWRPHVQRAEVLGRELYLLDKVSAMGTDELMKHVPDLRKAGLGGCLPVREADDNLEPKDSFMVTFFTREEPPRIAYPHTSLT